MPKLSVSLPVAYRQSNVCISKIDANSGFWTLPMDPDSQLLTTFNTPWGRFCFLEDAFLIEPVPVLFSVLDGCLFW